MSSPLAIMPWMGIELAGVEVRADWWTEACATAIESVSGYVVVVISVLESRAVTLVSSYLANVSGRTAVSHLCTRPHATAAFSQRMLDVMPGETHARACLLDRAGLPRTSSVVVDCFDLGWLVMRCEAVVMLSSVLYGTDILVV